MTKKKDRCVINIYRLKMSPKVIYAFANKDQQQADERRDQRNADLVFVKSVMVFV